MVPAAGAAGFLVGQALRRRPVRVWRRRGRQGTATVILSYFLTTAYVVVCLVLMLVDPAAAGEGRRHRRGVRRQQQPGGVRRADRGDAADARHDGGGGALHAGRDWRSACIWQRGGGSSVVSGAGAAGEPAGLEAGARGAGAQ